MHGDKRQRLYLHNTATGEDRKVLTSETSSVSDVEWSPDSQWLAYVHEDKNQFNRLWLMDAATGHTRVLTSDRYHHRSPAFSPDGKWLYFLSARTLQPTVTGPWGQRNMGTTFERDTKIYALALTADAKWPFQPRTNCGGRGRMRRARRHRPNPPNPNRLPPNPPSSSSMGCPRGCSRCPCPPATTQP